MATLQQLVRQFLDSPVSRYIRLLRRRDLEILYDEMADRLLDANPSELDDEDNRDLRLAMIVCKSTSLPPSEFNGADFEQRFCALELATRDLDPKSSVSELDAWLSHSDLAKRFDVDGERLRARLRRWRQQTPYGEWREVECVRKNEPRYLYLVRAVLDVIEDLKSAEN